MVDASNATLFGVVTADGVSVQCVYKPVRGERPLWDFPDGTLAGREVASYLVSEAAGWHVVPPTLLREGPFGPGMVQAWVETEHDADLVDVCTPAEVPSGWLGVLRARDAGGAPAVLVHADDPRLQSMAVFDVVVNNADRKGGHILVADPRGEGGQESPVYGVDHGLTMHVEPKLRTVLWGWVGAPLPEQQLAALRRLRAALAGGLCESLGEHLTRAEVRALGRRVADLLDERRFPEPSGFGPAIPWPAF